MVKIEILYNEKLNNYTLKKEIGDQNSIKKSPIKYKPEDKTAKYRKEILREELEN